MQCHQIGHLKQLHGPDNQHCPHVPPNLKHPVQFLAK